MILLAEQILCEVEVFSRIGMVGILLPHCQQPIAMSSPSPRFELVTAGKQHWVGGDFKEERGRKGKLKNKL